MSSKSANYNLTEPSIKDTIKDTITSLASNVETLDTNLKSVSDKTTTNETSLNSLSNRVGVNEDDIKSNSDQIGNLSVFVNVKDSRFGAKGDYNKATGHGTDDTTSIQDALDYLYSHGGGVLYFPLGNYKVTQPLIVKTVAADGGYSYPRISLIGEGNNGSTITKIGQAMLYSKDAACILIKGSTLNINDDFSGVKFENINIYNGSDGATTYGVYGYSGSRVIADYSSFGALRDLATVNSHNRYGFFMETGWSWSFRDCTFNGDYGFYNNSSSTSLLLENCFAGTDKIGYRINGVYSTLINTYGDFCSGTLYEFYYATNVHCTAIGGESPNCTKMINILNSSVTIDQAFFNQSNADTGTVIYANGSNLKIKHLYVSMQATNNGYLWNGGTSNNIRIDKVTLSNSSKFKYSANDNMPTQLNSVFISPDEAITTGGLSPLLNGFVGSYWDWYMETPKYPMNNIIMGLKAPTVSSMGNDFGWDKGGLLNGVYINSNFSEKNVLGWVRFAQTGTNLRDGFNYYIPLIRQGATANRPTWQTIGMEYFDTTLGKPIWCKTAGVTEVDTLTINSGATTSGNITITLNGSAVTVAVSVGDSVGTIGDKIRATAFSGWTVSGSAGSATVTFTKNTTGTNSAPTFADTGTTGSTGSFAVTAAGTNPVWVDSTSTAV